MSDAGGNAGAARYAIDTITVAANGLQFAVDTCGSGDRLALCLHGFPEASISWRQQLPLLAQLGYRAWAPNLRGYGRTTRPAAVDAYRADRLVADVAGLNRCLRREIGDAHRPRLGCCRGLVVCCGPRASA